MSISCVIKNDHVLCHHPLHTIMIHSFQVVRKPEEGDYIGHLRAEALMEMARIFQVNLSYTLPTRRVSLLVSCRGTYVFCKILQVLLYASSKTRC